MSKSTTPKIWFKTARQVYQYLTCPIGEEFLWGEGDTAVKDKGIVYSVSEKTVYNHTDDKDGTEKLKRNRKRCFARRTVDLYAKTHLAKVVSDADPAEELETEMTDTQATAAKRMEADTEVKQVMAQLKALELKRELGKTVSTAVAEREAGEKAQALKLHLTSFMRDFAPELLSHVGGDFLVAKEIIELVGGDEEQAEALSGFVYSRRPLLLEAFRRQLLNALNVYAKGEWFTDEMRQAWDKLVTHRKEAEIQKALDLVTLVGGDVTKLALVLERFEVCEREA
ncbi:MAG: hypothetical protein ACNI27_12815 [Desulfovibrio sp.]